MSIFSRQQRFFPLFLQAAAKSALRNLTVKCHVLLTSLISAMRNLTSYGPGWRVWRVKFRIHNTVPRRRGCHWHHTWAIVWHQDRRSIQCQREGCILCELHSMLHTELSCMPEHSQQSHSLRVIFLINYKQQWVNRPLTCCNIQQCIHDTVFELCKISFAIFSR